MNKKYDLFSIILFIFLIIMIASCGRKAPLIAPEEVKKKGIFKSYSKDSLKLKLNKCG